MNRAPDRKSSARLVLQKPFLAPDPAIIAGEGAALANHAVAGNEDRYGVVSVGVSNSPAGLHVTYGRRYLLIGTGFPIGNAAKRIPDLPVELGSLRGKVQLKGFSLSGKVFVKLRDALPDNRVGIFRSPFFAEPYCCDGLIICLDFHKPDGGLVVFSEHLFYTFAPYWLFISIPYDTASAIARVPPAAIEGETTEIASLCSQRLPRCASAPLAMTPRLGWGPVMVKAALR